ncbi:hypothetical protein [Streptomyces sp. 900105245]
MKKRTTIIVAVAAVTIVGGALSSNDKGDDASKPAAAPAAKKSTKAAETPAYKITRRDTDGNQRAVTVEVKSTKGLRAVFDDVAGKLTEPAAYFVEINCATGGTSKVDNRLANGRKAVGNIGVAATGLGDGKTDYEAQKGRTCPA